MPTIPHLAWIAALTLASTPLPGSPVVPLTGVGLHHYLNTRGCAFVDKRLHCWGDNREGQLGIGGSSITSLAEWIRRPDTRTGEFIAPTSIAIGEGQHYCVSDAGSVWCWGKNPHGQLGLGHRNLRETPTRVPGLPDDIQQVLSGHSTSCARSAADGVWCWGFNSSGMTGQPPIDRDPATGAPIEPAEPSPRRVPGLPAAVDALAIGGAHVCALAAGRVSCWGDNTKGQLGDGGTSTRSSPATVASLPEMVRAIAAGPQHSCALAGDGGVWCWGNNDAGQVGRAATDPRNPEPLPVRVAGLPGPATALHLSYGRSCASVANQRWCWGETEDRVRSHVPREVARPQGAPEDWLDGCFPVAGALQCAGGSFRHPSSALDARLIPGVEGQVVQLALGRYFGCARTAAGAIWCWGLNDFGQLGQGNLNNSTVAVRVDLPAAHSLAAGHSHACAATGSGLWCWGRNVSGVLGDGTTTSRSLPVRAQFDATLVAAGSAHTCAWTASDGLRCWGNNTSGQVDGMPSAEPVLTGARPLGSARILELGLGSHHSCATIELGAGQLETRCWGNLPLTPEDLSLGVRDRSPRLMPPGAPLRGDGQVVLRSSAFSACLGDRCYGMNYLPTDRGEVRVGAIVNLPDGLSGGFLLGGRMACAQGAGTELQCAGLIGRACHFENRSNLIFSPGQWIVCRAQEDTLTPLERGWLPLAGVGARPRHFAASDEIACGSHGSQIWCWGVIPIAWAPMPAYSPVYRAGATEPSPTVALPRDPARPCPAYAVAAVSLLDPADPSSAGHWGLDLELADGNRYLHGGLNFGGYGSDVGNGVPGYAAFSIQNPAGGLQVVDLDLSGDGGEFVLTVESTLPPSTARTVVLRETVVLGATPLRRSLTLRNGFHIVGLQPTSGTRLFLAAVGTTQPGGGPAAFQGGAVVGGYLAGERTGFAAVCAADASAIRLRTQARSTRDASAAGDLRLRVIEGLSGAMLYDSE